MAARNSRSQILFQDEILVIAIKDMVLTPGQITIFPRQHFTILELVPDDVLAKCAAMANKVSSAVFESLEAEGTNILVQNGLGAGQKAPHFSIEVIPRREEDGLQLQWQNKEMSNDELDIVAQQLQEETGKLGAIEKKAAEKNEVKIEPAAAKVPAKIEDKKKEKSKENYLVRSLRKIP